MLNSIYVEERALNYPITIELLQKYTNLGCNIIYIRHYKDVFNRTNQNFRIQKQHQALILAVKDSPFIYKGAKVCQNFGYKNFYYTSFLLNCIFDCEYCYLQGMYPSANLVAFVNIEDFKCEIDKIVMNDSCFLAASYDTDLLAFNNVIPYMDYFYTFIENHQNLCIEVRTKSVNQNFYETHAPLNNLIIAFTLSPQEVIKKYEKYTPSLSSRIEAIQKAISYGFKVRLCFDPVFIHPELNGVYESFYEDVFTKIAPDKVIDVGYGFFRMSGEFFKRIEKQLGYSQLFSQDYHKLGDVVSYPPALQEDIRIKHIEFLAKYIEKEKIFSL